jgi:hypothetical protein
MNREGREGCEEYEKCEEVLIKDALENRFNRGSAKMPVRGNIKTRSRMINNSVQPFAVIPFLRDSVFSRLRD